MHTYSSTSKGGTSGTEIKTHVYQCSDKYINCSDLIGPLKIGVMAGVAPLLENAGLAWC